MKSLEDELTKLKRKKLTSIVEKDTVSVAKSVQDVTEKAARLNEQAEEKLRKKKQELEVMK